MTLPRVVARRPPTPPRSGASGAGRPGAAVRPPPQPWLPGIVLAPVKVICELDALVTSTAPLWNL